MMLKRISKKSSRNIYPTSVGRNLERNSLFFEKMGIISYHTVKLILLDMRGQIQVINLGVIFS